MSSNDMTKYRGYILYGRSIENLFQRVIMFSGGCGKLIVDSSLGWLTSRMCAEDPTVVEFRSYEDIDKAIASGEEGKAIVFAVDVPREGVYAIALIPIDRFNKSRVVGR